VGKVYMAKPEVNDVETVALESLEVINDVGEKLKVSPEKEEFEYLDEVYAVVAKPFEDLDVGEVVALDGATEDRSLYHLKGMGYRGADYFVILDRTNVFPGLTVLDCHSNKWVSVRRVDECLWIVTDGDEMRSPSEFMFAVSGGDILAEPIVKCIEATGKPNLTEGRLYVLKGRDRDGMLILEDDSGEEGTFAFSRFSMDS